MQRRMRRRDNEKEKLTPRIRQELMYTSASSPYKHTTSLPSQLSNDWAEKGSEEYSRGAPPFIAAAKHTRKTHTRRHIYTHIHTDVKRKQREKGGDHPTLHPTHDINICPKMEREVTVFHAETNENHQKPWDPRVFRV